jgi:hypothetical protein
MSAISAPFGLRPVFHPSGVIRPRALAGGINSGYGSTILANQPVLLSTSGLLNPVTANNVDFIGVFAGVEYTTTGGTRRVVDNKWIASTTYDTGSLIAYFYDDPAIVYEIQADGSVAQTALGDQVNLSNFANGSTLTGLSQATAGATPVGSGSQGQLRVIDKGLGIDNDWGDAYTVLRTQIARHQYTSNKVAF